MTPKEENSLRTKIARIKANLAADKRRWGGCYHDGSGNRYKPPHLYIQLGDYFEGLRYMNWFEKNFPDDSCYPLFYFEWTVILFMKKKNKEAQRKAFKTYCSNIYVFDKYFGKELKKVEKSEKSNTETIEYCINFDYSYQKEEFSSFNIWLTKFINSEKFNELSNEFISLKKELKSEKNIEKRTVIIERKSKLIDEI